jgi:predicted AAA+ superfamily ATPase
MFARKCNFRQGVSCFVLGPRGTGKTYWLHQLYPDAVFIDLLEARTFNQLAADPQRLDNLIGTTRKENPIIIDEIQKLPSLLDEVHRLIEGCNAWFILTGSSARKLRQAGVNLLGGRAVTKQFHPLTAAELGEAFDLAKALKFGLLPSLYDSNKQFLPDEYLQSYVQTCLKEEVIQEGLTRNLSAFSRFWEAASFSQGQLLNITEVARECQIKRKLAENYFGILEDLLIGICLPPFQKRARRRVTQHPKFFLFDAGVFRAVRPRGPLDSAEEIDGAALETLVFQHLRAILSFRSSGGTLSYWRTATGLEVDFVVYAEDAFVAIEVKRKRTLSAHDLRGMKAFASEYPEARKVVLYGGDHEEVVDGIQVIPLVKALLTLESIVWPDQAPLS